MKLEFVFDYEPPAGVAMVIDLSKPFEPRKETDFTASPVTWRFVVELESCGDWVDGKQVWRPKTL